MLDDQSQPVVFSVSMKGVSEGSLGDVTTDRKEKAHEEGDSRWHGQKQEVLNTGSLSGAAYHIQKMKKDLRRW